MVVSEISAPLRGSQEEKGTGGRAGQRKQCGQRLESLASLAYVGERASENRRQLSWAAQGLEKWAGSSSLGNLKKKKKNSLTVAPS